MLKAQQSAVVQNANINLVNIRNAEINYFSQFFSSFGVQAALIAGFSINSVSQVPALDADCHVSWKYIYWITSAITFTAAMHVIICSVYISVFGQGYALRGPLGSMVSAVNGMVVEQEQVVTAFLVTIVALAFNLVGTYGIMMDLNGALISSAITIVGLGFWYHFTLRIYNRFKFAEQKGGFDDEEDEPFADADESSSKKGTLPGPKQKKAKAKTSSMSKFFFGRKKSSNFGYSNDSGSLRESRRSDESEGVDAPSTDVDASIFSGSLSMKSEKRFSGGAWERRFVVLKGKNANMYTSKLEFERNPLKTINKRPVSFEGFTVEGVLEDDLFMLYLNPLDEDDERRPWEFRCDTKQELEEWVMAFRNVLYSDEPSAVDVPSSRSVAGTTVASSRLGSRSEISTVMSYRTTN